MARSFGDILNSFITGFMKMGYPGTDQSVSNPLYTDAVIEPVETYRTEKQNDTFQEGVDKYKEYKRSKSNNSDYASAVGYDSVNLPDERGVPRDVITNRDNDYEGSDENKGKDDSSYTITGKNNPANDTSINYDDAWDKYAAAVGYDAANSPFEAGVARDVVTGRDKRPDVINERVKLTPVGSEIEEESVVDPSVQREIEGNPDFSDTMNDWLSRIGYGLGYTGTGDFVFNGDEQHWKDFVQDEKMKVFYQDLFDTDGAFSEDKWRDYWNKYKSRPWNELFDKDNGKATYSASDVFGGDYETVSDILGYLYDNEKLGVDDEAIDNNDRQAVLDAILYQYAMNAAMRSISDEGNGDFEARFAMNPDNLNKFFKNDYYEIGKRTFTPGNDYKSAEELGFTNLDDPYYAIDTPYDDGNVHLSSTNMPDYVLAALGDAYGAKLKR